MLLNVVKISKNMPKTTATLELYSLSELLFFPLTSQR